MNELPLFYYEPKSLRLIANIMQYFLTYYIFVNVEMKSLEVAQCQGRIAGAWPFT